MLNNCSLSIQYLSIIVKPNGNIFESKLKLQYQHKTTYITQVRYIFCTEPVVFIIRQTSFHSAYPAGSSCSACPRFGALPLCGWKSPRPQNGWCRFRAGRRTAAAPRRALRLHLVENDAIPDGLFQRFYAHRHAIGGDGQERVRFFKAL